MADKRDKKRGKHERERESIRTKKEGHSSFFLKSCLVHPHSYTEFTPPYSKHKDRCFEYRMDHIKSSKRNNAQKYLVIQRNIIESPLNLV